MAGVDGDADTLVDDLDRDEIPGVLGNEEDGEEVDLVGSVRPDATDVGNMGEVTKADVILLVGKELVGRLDLDTPEAGTAGADQVVERTRVTEWVGDTEALGHGALDEDGLRKFTATFVGVHKFSQNLFEVHIKSATVCTVARGKSPFLPWHSCGMTE